MDSPGRSGARMLSSQDGYYFIKTLVSEEVEQMHHILKQYHQVRGPGQHPLNTFFSVLNELRDGQVGHLQNLWSLC